MEIVERGALKLQKSKQIKGRRLMHFTFPSILFSPFLSLSLASLLYLSSGPPYLPIFVIISSTCRGPQLRENSICRSSFKSNLMNFFKGVISSLIFFVNSCQPKATLKIATFVKFLDNTNSICEHWLHNIKSPVLHFPVLPGNVFPILPIAQRKENVGN